MKTLNWAILGTGTIANEMAEACRNTDDLHMR